MAAVSASSDAPLGPKDFDGWFTEVEAMWKGQRLSLQVKEVLHHEKTDFQEVLVFDSVSWGRVLVLDGVIQLTTKDECAYHEMMAHVPLLTHQRPDRVLIVGGGDGGLLREVVKHGRVTEVVLCEIDERVISIARRFFPEDVATAFDDECLSIVAADAAEYLSTKVAAFDVIIVDSSDPTDADAPATPLYAPAFIKDCAAALRPGGVLCMQGECMWLEGHRKVVQATLQAMGPHFGVRDYAVFSVPTYPCGQIGMILGAKVTEADIPDMKERELLFRKPRRFQDINQTSGPLKYYGPYVHEAAFALPRFAREAIADETCDNFIASSDLPEGLPTPEAFQMLFWGMLGGGLVAGMVVGRFLLTRLF